MNIKLISVLYMKIKRKQASRCVQPIIYLYMITRTINLPSGVHVQSVKPAMKQSTYHFSQISLCDDKNCQSTKSLFDDKNCESTKSLCDDKNCQSTRCAHIWPVKPAMPQSSYMKVTQSTHLQLV